MRDEKPLRALIVDDEALAREFIESLLQNEPDIEVAATCADGSSAVESILEQRPDLVFLDVQMPGMDGFDVLEALDDETPPLIIFVTAYDQYAIQAFEVHALDYLLKPIDTDRFQKALQRAREQIRRKRDLELEPKLWQLLREMALRKEYPRRIVLKVEGRSIIVQPAEISWVGAEGNYIRVHTSNGAYFVRDTLTRFGSQLDPRQFRRIHRSTIVNIDQIREIQPLFHGDYCVRLYNGQELTLSRNYKSRYQDFLTSP